MIYCNDKVFTKISQMEDDNTYILMDFDRTITSADSQSSWGIISSSNLVPKDYVIERQELFNYYRPLEINPTIDVVTKNALMAEWWQKHLNLLAKYELNEEALNKVKLSLFKARKGIFSFLKNMQERQIPVIILSAGVGNLIEMFLNHHQAYYDNIYILANFIEFKNGKMIGLKNQIIHGLNKNEDLLPLAIQNQLISKNNIILLGDSQGDAQMNQENNLKNTLKIGFLEENITQNLPYYQQDFDVVATNNTSYQALSRKLTFLKK